MMKTAACVAAIVLLGGRTPAGEATYFVAGAGDDSNPGTEARPWKTLRKAADAVQAGDTVRLRAGDYFVGPTWPNGSAAT